MKKFKYIFCDKSFKTELCEFISANWKKNHILSINDRLLDWQYKDDKGNYNFVLAVENKKIIGILGYIPSNKFSNINNFNFCLALWCIDKKISYPGIGIGMISFLKKEKKLKGIYTIGLSKDAVEIYNSLKYNVSYFSHYIFINKSIREFKILKNVNKSLSHFDNQLNRVTSLREITLKSDINEIFNKHIDTKNNFKNINYLVRRYINHPIYNYRMFYVSNNYNNGCILVIRKVNVNKSTALRIIDCIGDVSLISCVGNSVDQLLKEEKHEYLDFLQYGIDSIILKKGGFSLVEDLNDLVVPNNFEPFEQKNKKIFLAFKSFQKENNFNCFFKGDGDQDRPNKF